MTVGGAEQPAIRVRVDPARLAAMGVSMEDVRTAIANANAVGPLGTFDGAKRGVTIGINDQLRTASDYDPLVVKTVERHRDPAVDDRHDPAQRAQQPLGRLVQQQTRRCC